LTLLLLDTWYNEELYKPDIDSKQRFFDILKEENVRLGALASKMINDQYHDGNSSNAEESEETIEENNNNYLQSNTEAANVDSAHPEIEESIESSALFLGTHDQEENRVQIEDDENQRDSNNYGCVKILLPMLMFSKKRWKYVFGIAGWLALATLILVNYGKEDNVQEGNNIQKEQKEESYKGLITVDKKAVRWDKMCPSDRYSSILDDMEAAMENYGMNQVGDELWVCGGKLLGGGKDLGHSKNCSILSLLDGTWRPFKYKMNLPRLRPVVYAEAGKVVVKGGTTSNIHSNTGCRDTQEVFNKADQSEAWALEDIADNISCRRSSQRTWTISIDCL